MIENYFDNAVNEIEAGHTFEDFRTNPENVKLCDETGVSMQNIWDIAVYTCETLKEYWMQDTEDMCDRDVFEREFDGSNVIHLVYDGCDSQS